MTDSPLDAAEKRAHEALRDLVISVSCGIPIGELGTAKCRLDAKLFEATSAAIRDLRREAFKAGLERAAQIADDRNDHACFTEVICGRPECYIRNDIARALAEAADHE